VSGKQVLGWYLQGGVAWAVLQMTTTFIGGGGEGGWRRGGKARLGAEPRIVLFCAKSNAATAPPISEPKRSFICPT